MARRVALACTALVALVTAVLLTPAASGSGTAKYTVTALDFRFRNMPARVPAGRHTFILVNRGDATHDIRLAGKKTRLLNKGQRASIVVRLRKGRKYAYVCTVPGHAALGMKGRLVAR